MATLNFKIIPSRRKSSGKYGLYISLTHKKKVRYISTEFEVNDEAEFDNETGRVCYRKDAAIMNKRMNYVLHEYEEKLLALDLRKFDDVVQLKDALTRQEVEDNITIESIFDERIARFRKEHRTNYAMMNSDSKEAILSMIGNMRLATICRTDITQLCVLMQRKGYSAGGIQIKLAHLKAAINEAIDMGRVKYETHPFSGIKIPTSAPREMDISVDEIQRIIELNSTSKRVMLARDMFLLSFYLGGINLVDLLELNISGDTLSYQRNKTRGRDAAKVSIHIPEAAKEIIAKYQKGSTISLGYRYTEYKTLAIYINKCLKLLAKEVGITGSFSFYAARKTFAQLSADIGIPDTIIDYCLGHSDRSRGVIRFYTKVRQEQADMALQRVIEYVHDPTKYKDFIELRNNMMMMRI